jgi:hypothetical protein
MKKIYKIGCKVWKDPVWSKVISVIILATLAKLTDVINFSL